MTTYTVQARVSEELKEEAEAIFSAIGLKTGEAIRLFLQQCVNTGGLPFQPRVKQPSARTLAAIDELEKGGGKKFANVDDLFEDLDD